MSGGWQYSHANERNTVTVKEDVKQKFSCCSIIWTLDLLVFIKLNFLRSLTPHSHSRNKWWLTQVVIILPEKEKKTGCSCTWIYFNIYLCKNYFIRFMISYTMRRTCVPNKVRRSPKLRGARRSPGLSARSTDFRVPDTQISPAQSTFGKGKLMFARFQC